LANVGEERKSRQLSDRDHQHRQYGDRLYMDHLYGRVPGCGGSGDRCVLGWNGTVAVGSFADRPAVDPAPAPRATVATAARRCFWIGATPALLWHIGRG